MSHINIETPPEELSDAVKDYLTRQFVNTNIALGQSQHLDPITVMPYKPQAGDSYFFSIPVEPDIDEAGFWGYIGSEWVNLQNLGPIPLPVPAYGGLTTDALNVMDPVDHSWYTVYAFHIAMLDEPINIVQDVAGSALEIEQGGTYKVDVNLTIRHLAEEPAEGVSPRVLRCRIYNPDTGQEYPSVKFGTPSGADLTPMVIAAQLVEVAEGDRFVVQIGGGMSYSGITIGLNAGHFTMIKISQE